MARKPRQSKTVTDAVQSPSGEEGKQGNYSDQPAGQDADEIVVKTLKNILTDDSAASAARASAARTLAEINGQIGRHSAPSTTDDTPLSELTVPQLEAKLAALEAENAEK